MVEGSHLAGSMTSLRPPRVRVELRESGRISDHDLRDKAGDPWDVTLCDIPRIAVAPSLAAVDALPAFGKRWPAGIGQAQPMWPRFPGR